MLVYYYKLVPFDAPEGPVLSTVIILMYLSINSSPLLSLYYDDWGDLLYYVMIGQ